MEFLITKTPDEFERYIIPWKEHMQPFLEDFRKEIQTSTAAGKHYEVRAYGTTFLSWPIRRLEYSYVLKETLGHVFPGCKILDCGCGVVPLARVYRKMGCDAYACDNDPNIIGILREAKYISDRRVNYSCQDISHLDFPSEMFDLITCVSVLEHMTPGTDTVAVSEMLRVLRRGGRLVCTVDFEPQKRRSLVRSIIEATLTGRLFFRSIRLLKEEPLRLPKTVPTIFRGKRTTEGYRMEDFEQRIFYPFSMYVLGSKPQRIPSVREIHDFWRQFWRPRSRGCPGLSVPHYLSIGFTMRKLV